MPRLPIVQVETGPLVAPALAMANQIREGRARVAISEEGARQAPLETQSKRLALEEQPKAYERAAAQEQRAQGQETRAQAQEGRATEQEKRQQWADANKAYETALPRMRDAKSHNAAVSGIAERTGVPIEELGGLLDENMPQADFVKHMERMIPAFHEAKYKHDLRLKEIEAQGKSQEKVANIYAGREGRDYDKLRPESKRLIDNDLEREYEMDWMQPSDPDDPDSPWVPKPGAPNKEAWKKKKFKERVDLYEGRAPQGAGAENWSQFDPQGEGQGTPLPFPDQPPSASYGGRRSLQ